MTSQVSQGFTLILKFSKNGDCVTSLGSLFSCLPVLILKKFLLIPSLNFSCFSPLPLALPPYTPMKSLFLSS